MNHFSIICIHCFILFYSTVCFGEVGSFSEIVGGESKVITEALFFKRDKKLWVMDSEGSNQRQLTKYDVQEFMVSKNGAVILFKSNHNWYVFRVAIKKCQKIPDGYIKTGSYYSPALSPDGSKLAIIYASSKFSELAAKQYKKKYYANVSTGDVKSTYIQLYDINTGELSKLVVNIPRYLLPKSQSGHSVWLDQFPYWSEDGSKLHFQRSFHPYDEKCSSDDSYIIDINTKKIKYLGNHDQIQDWRGDILVYVNPGGYYLLDISTLKSYDPPNPADSFRYSPDMSRAIYVQYSHSSDDNRTKLILRLSNGEKKELFSSKDAHNLIPFWGKTNEDIYYWYENKYGNFFKKIKINQARTFTHTAVAKNINGWSMVFVPFLTEKFHLVRNIDGKCIQPAVEKDSDSVEQTGSSGSFSDFVRD